MPTPHRSTHFRQLSPRTRTPLQEVHRQYIGQRDSFYLSTASADGEPYVQHRGGPPGFLTLLDSRTLAFADFSGNRQYMTLANLRENNRVMLFLMDYRNRRRLKLWGNAEVFHPGEPGLEQVVLNAQNAPIERVLVIHVEVWDWNCPQYINQNEREM